MHVVSDSTQTREHGRRADQQLGQVHAQYRVVAVETTTKIEREVDGTVDGQRRVSRWKRLPGVDELPRLTHIHTTVLLDVTERAVDGGEVRPTDVDEMWT